MAALRWGGYGAAALFLWLVAASLGLIAILELWEALARVPAWSIPLQWPLYAWHYGGYHGVPEALLMSGGAATALAGACLASGVRSAGKKPLHGESHFATRREAERRGIAYSRRPSGDSILLGRTEGVLGLGRRYINLPGTDHVALYARTGAGKGVSFVVPVCLSYEGSLVAFDVKGELHRLTAGRRAAMGQEVFFFAPTAPDGRSHRYNPFSVVPRGGDGCVDAVHRIMHILVPPNPKAENPFWTNSARDLAIAGAVLLAETPSEPLNPAAVLRLFTRPDHGAAIRALVDGARSAGRPMPRASVDAILSWLEGEDPRTREGVLAELRSHLALYSNPQIAAATRESDFDLAAVRRRGVSIYVGIGPADLRRLRPLTTLLFQQLLDLNTQVEFDQDARHTHRVLMMLDEFAALGPANHLADACAFVRSYGLRMAYVVQTKSQLVSIYGAEGSENLFQNTGAEVVFGASDPKLCREISERAGADTVLETSRSRPRFAGWLHPAKQSENEAVQRRPLLLPQEVAMLPEREQLVFRPGMAPLRTRRIRWYGEAWFKAQTAPAPDVPALAVKIERD